MVGGSAPAVMIDFLGLPQNYDQSWRKIMRSDQITWFHSFNFPDGEKVEGIKAIGQLQNEADIIFSIPLSGMTVLDIGSWDGYFAFEAERRGASEVHATDHFCWSGPGWGTKDGFNYAHKKFNSKIASTDVSVPDLSPAKLGQFDITLFLGVLYHLTDPFGGLKAAADMTKKVLIVETVTALNDFPEPVMRYFLGPELGGDYSNYWAPNHLCLENMLREIGFSRFSFNPDPAPPEKYIRTIVHAWR